MGTNRYDLKWYMADLNRVAIYDVTANVTFANNSNPFNPVLYGIVQTLTPVINLQAVLGSADNYQHVQTIDVTLMMPGTQNGTNWTISHTAGQNPVYGTDLWAQSVMINQGNWTINLTSGCSSFQEWLNKFYYDTLPLYNSNVETEAPAPNMFSIVFGNTKFDFPISSWNQTLNITRAMPDASTLFIKFYRRVQDNDIMLSIAGVTVRQ
jgi:hypothetical protein